MRFRTNITNVPLLHKITRSLAALAKTCVIRLSEDKVHFIVPGNENKDGVQVWSQVDVNTLFDNFRIESNNNNEIWLEVHLDALLKVLRSADSSIGGDDFAPGAKQNNATNMSEGEISLKLNKRGSQAIWAFDIRGRSRLSNKPMQISHEINVRVLSQKRQEELQEPLCPPPDIHLVLPNLTELRNIISRLSTMADDVKVSANYDGTLQLSVNSQGVNLTTTWSNLHIPTAYNQEEDGAKPRDHLFSASVPIRAMQKFLTSHLVGGAAIACICDGHCVITYVYLGEILVNGGVLTFFIPGKTFGDNEYGE